MCLWRWAKYPLCCSLEFWFPRHPSYGKVGSQMASSMSRSCSGFPCKVGSVCNWISSNVQLGCGHRAHLSETRTKGTMRVHPSSSANRKCQSHDREKVEYDWRAEVARYFNKGNVKVVDKVLISVIIFAIPVNHLRERWTQSEAGPEWGYWCEERNGKLVLQI